MEEFLIRWTYLNVMEVRPDLDKTQCMIVLGFIAADHDPNIGVTFDTIYRASKVLFPIKTLTIH
ncbi:hypothetical protein [Flavobacterium sp.]|jgi:hypothetical protein|uniref:hypothetical protein n=1 Tax=Flavobacterium sp. TaxID=239 RepID=UPI0037BF9838